MDHDDCSGVRILEVVVVVVLSISVCVVCWLMYVLASYVSVASM
eukprot:SAG11_NODE_399_length_9764_cov_8.760993_6_plen_44_part_00